jgi:hypothetical protein
MDIYPFQNYGFDKDCNPIDFIDEDGIKWIYQGQEDEIDLWMGIPPED